MILIILAGSPEIGTDGRTLPKVASPGMTMIHA